MSATPSMPGSSTSALRIAVVGPTHPYKGGVAAHTTVLAHELVDAGHDVTLVSWRHLYPRLLYPGEQAVPGGRPDVEPFPRTIRALSWSRPDTWVRTGRRLRSHDVIVVVHVIPAVVPAHLALLRAAGTGPRTAVIAHNVLPHEPHLGDDVLMRSLLKRVDAVLVHSVEQARLARELGADRVVTAALPPHLPGGGPVDRPAHDGPPRLLALGLVRDYKGVDLVLEALRDVPGPTLTVAGEMWGSSGARVRELAADPRLQGRVTVRRGYVPADDIPALLARHDVMALTYRHATASQNVMLAHQHGLAVLATDVGTFGREVHDGIDGLVIPPSDPAALTGALRRLAEPGCVDRLRSAVQPPDLTGAWAHYIGALETLAAPPEAAATLEVTEPALRRIPTHGPGENRPLRERLGSLVTEWGRVTRTTVSIAAADLPPWVHPTDVATSEIEATLARDAARELGLPRGSEPLAAWAALGAIEALVRIADDGRRGAVVVDESGPGSPMAAWARAIGFEPVELGLTGERSGDDSRDIDAASLDIVTRLYPGGCDADDIDDTIGQAAWALRPGGLVSLTVPVGPATADGTLGLADVRAVLARADDLGLALVGNVDGEIARRMRRARRQAVDGTAAFALLRLTFRRR